MTQQSMCVNVCVCVGGRENASLCGLSVTVCVCVCLCASVGGTDYLGKSSTLTVTAHRVTHFIVVLL